MKAVFDIGGTSLRVARANPGAVAPGAGITHVRVEATPHDPEERFARLLSVLRELADEERVEAVAGGVAGVVARDGAVITSPNLAGWSGYPLGSKLAKALAVPVRIENDATCATLGEARYGAGAGARIVAYIGVGTGVGGGRVMDGALDVRAPGFEPGHQILEWGGGVTFEMLVSGGALAKKHGMHPRDLPRAVYAELTPALATGVYNAIAHWSPDIFVLGGSLMNEENGFRLGEVEQALHALPRRFPLPPLRSAALRDAAGLHGARALLEDAS